jgi:hypothetical protein
MHNSTPPNTQANYTTRKSTSRLSKDGKWRSFPRIPHLLQYVSSETYYARVRIVFSTAKL